MSVTRLDTPYIEGGIRSTNFFNGRLLSREDMQREQEAERAIHERLGRALGAGIVHGFEVAAKSIGGSSVKDPVVTVRAGLAVNRRGQTVALDRDVDVSLLKPAAPATGAAAASATGFGDCLPPESTVYVAGTGVYLLSAAPAAQKQGLALVSGLGNAGAACNANEVVQGVQFRLSQVKLTAPELADEARLRNVVAYKCFAAEGAGVEAVRDPFGAPAPAVTLTDPALTDCDVPLALLHWTATGGLRFVDLWAVRRVVTAIDGPSWPLPLGLRRRNHGFAMWRQFQNQLETLRSGAALSLAAINAFTWLPPLGILPLGVVQGTRGFDMTRFFAKQTTRGPLYVEGARLGALLEIAFSFPPIKLRASDSASPSEVIWLYFVRENREPLAGIAPAQPYIVFARGDVPYQADAHFDVSRFDYANIALGGDLI